VKKDCSFSTVSTPRSLAPPMSRNWTPWSWLGSGLGFGLALTLTLTLT